MALPAEAQAEPNGLSFMQNQMTNVMHNVDDLFGEDVNLTMATPATELRWRTDEQRRRGCCQYVPPPSSLSATRRLGSH